MGVGRSEDMYYLVSLDWVEGYEPSFAFDTLEEAMDKVQFFLEQGYKVYIELKRYEKEEE